MSGVSSLLRAVLYEPEGIRGSCPAIRQANYGPPNWKEFQDEANREILVIPLIEDPRRSIIWKHSPRSRGSTSSSWTGWGGHRTTAHVQL